jgi:outer membrane protein assembly factor BamA
MPVPFYTIAGRIMHYGRYGTGAEDGRLSPLYLGYPSLVRGYDVYTFDASECIGDFQSSCPAADNLSGSRILVGNLELRFPLLRPFGVTQRMYGPVPVEVALFADAGVAWDQRSSPEFAGGTREAVTSVGWSFRTNLGGVIVAEFAFSKPLQRNTGLVFQFNFAPGF